MLTSSILSFSHNAFKSLLWYGCLKWAMHSEGSNRHCQRRKARHHTFLPSFFLIYYKQCMGLRVLVHELSQKLFGQVGVWRNKRLPLIRNHSFNISAIFHKSRKIVFPPHFCALLQTFISFFLYFQPSFHRKESTATRIWVYRVFNNYDLNLIIVCNNNISSDKPFWTFIVPWVKGPLDKVTCKIW